MRLFSLLYKKMMLWSQHRYAPFYLSCLSFLESSVFPIAPDVMLAPMSLANPQRAWWYALLTTITSVIGGVMGYVIGRFFLHLIYPYIVQLGYEVTYHQVVDWFTARDFWVIVIAGFTPIPYKLFTIGAGAMHMALFPFILGSCVGRGGRFFLVAAFMRYGGRSIQKLCERYIERIGWIVLIAFLLIYIVIQLVACTGEDAVAPVIEGWRQAKQASSVYRVSEEDTLYSIAWRYGLDYRELAATNHIVEPYTLRAGQRLQLVPAAATTVAAKPKRQDVKAKAVVVTQTSSLLQSQESTLIPPQKTPHGIQWHWPVSGKIIRDFSGPAGMSKGIDIAGRAGEVVKAAADGKVVYCGSGLKGYGELLIVKHNDEFLSAYAHNRKLLIREGQWVKQGQVIAEMGRTDAPRVMLHFEIRRAGKPVDPLKYLHT